MSGQIDLFSDEAPRPTPETRAQRWRRLYDDGTYPTDWWVWLEDNYHVLARFIDIALEAKQRRGFKVWSARGLYEVLRWQTGEHEGGQDHLKLNNNGAAGCARLAMHLEPRLAGFFRTRTPPGRDQARRLKDGKLYGSPDDGDDDDV